MESEKSDVSYVVSIAGHDPTGGAGITADIKAFHHCGVQGFSAATAFTVQDAKEVHRINWIDYELISLQLSPLVNSYTIKAVKIGLIHDIGMLWQVLQFMKHYAPGCFVVWDPVIASSSGYQFHSNMDANQLNMCLSMIDLITPNRDEYKLLSEWLNIVNIVDFPVKNLILKGGHMSGDNAVDELWTSGTKVHEISQPRLDRSIHGSGCVFSSVIAAEMTKSDDLKWAFIQANSYVRQLLESEEDQLGKHHLVEL